MKNAFTFLAVWLVTTTVVHSQEYSDKVTKNFTFRNDPAKSVLYIANINGSVTVESYSGSEIRIEGERSIKAKNASAYDKAKAEFGLGIIDKQDSAILYLTGICGSENWMMSRPSDKKWSYYTEDCRQDFDFRMNLTIKVPADLNIYISTINNGDVKVSGVNGSLNLHNVNGDVFAEGIRKPTVAKTINGDVELYFDRVPDSGTFYTLNGDINMWMPQGFSANATFKSFNGDIYTNVDDVSQQPVLNKTASTKKGTSFKAEISSTITFRKGGGLLKIETFNGNAYVKEK